MRWDKDAPDGVSALSHEGAVFPRRWSRGYYPKVQVDLSAVRRELPETTIERVCRRISHLLRWQRKLKNSAVRLRRCRPKAPTVTFDNGAANRKPKADATGLGC